MNWLVLAVTGWILFGLELGMRDLLAIGPGRVAPSFIAALVAVVALSAPARTALWAGLALGLVADLTRLVDQPDGGVTTIVGPYALGFMLGAHLVVTIRGALMRRNPLTVGFATMALVAIAQVVVVALTTLRSFYEPIVWSAGSELLLRLGSAVYSGLAAILLSLVLLPLSELLGFAHAPGHAAPQRFRIGMRNR